MLVLPFPNNTVRKIVITLLARYIENKGSARMLIGWHRSLGTAGLGHCMVGAGGFGRERPSINQSPGEADTETAVADGRARSSDGVPHR